LKSPHIKSEQSISGKIIEKTLTDLIFFLLEEGGALGSGIKSTGIGN
jgi:hypothetical protein